MFFKSVSPMLKMHLDVCQKLNICLIIWDPKTSKVKQIESNKIIKYIKIHSLYMFAYTGVSLWGFKRYWKILSIQQLMITILFLIGNILFLMCRQSVIQHAKDMVKLLNDMAQVENAQLKGLYFVK